MKKKNTVKLILDIIMLLAVTLFFSKNILGLRFHELGGLILCGVFVVHILFNIPWLRAVPKRFFDKTLPLKTKIGAVVNLLLVFGFGTIAMTGIMISKTIFTGISGSGMGWKTTHYFVSALTIILLGVHIGLHISWIKAMTCSGKKKNSGARKAIFAAVMAATVCFGVYNMASTSFLRWLSMPIAASAGDRQRPAGEMQGERPQKNAGRPELPTQTEDVPPERAENLSSEGKEEMPSQAGQAQPPQGGENAGMPKGERQTTLSVPAVLMQVLKFASMILTFSVATGLLSFFIEKRKAKHSTHVA